MLRMAAWPISALGPTRCSQIKSPVRASSAWTTFMMLMMYSTPLCTSGVGSLPWPSVIAQVHTSCKSFAFSRVICVSGLWLQP